MNARRFSKALRIGDVTVGGNAPIVVQSMAKTDTRDVAATVRQIKEMEEHGCQLVRVAVPDSEAADALRAIKKGITIPLIADIHFDHRLALAALDAGVDGLRLNPGNLSAPEHVQAVARAARERAAPIRIGVNAGSLPQRERHDPATASKMVALALQQVKLLESFDFDLIKLSLKAFDVPTTVAAYTEIAGRVSYPLHLGVTEAGPARQGLVRSAVGLGILLAAGIGDTLRVSLTAPPREEVSAAFEILKSLNLRRHGPTMVSCPTCGRTEIDMVPLAQAVEQYLARIEKPITIAIMGCVVNGPGEARDADLGLACGKGRAVLFKKGVQYRTVSEADALAVLQEEIDRLVQSD